MEKAPTGDVPVSIGQRPDGQDAWSGSGPSFLIRWFRRVPIRCLRQDLHEDLRQFVNGLRRHQDGEGTAHDLRGGIAIASRSAPAFQVRTVPSNVLGDDRVIR